MAWLILDEGEAGELEIPIVPDGATRRIIKIGGEYTRSFNGTLRSTVSVEKVELELQTLPLSESDANAIEAKFANGNEFELGGDVVGTGNEFTAKGTVLESGFVMDDLLHRRELRLLFQQV